MIWEPFILALVLGLIVSAGLYFAYLWPSAEPVDDEPAEVPGSPAEIAPPVAQATDGTEATDGTTTTTDAPTSAAGSGPAQ